MNDGVTRRRFVGIAGAAAAGVAFGGGIGAALAGTSTPGKASTGRGRRPPNILFIVMDQERSWADLPADLDLPVRRRFAAGALSFTQYHVNTTPCAPARAYIWTGQPPQAHGVIANPGHAGSRELDPARTPTIAQMLKRHGYYTAIKGKWHLSDLSRLATRDHTRALRHVGYDEWQQAPDTFGRVHEGAALDASIAEGALEFLTHRPQALGPDRPWFLTVNFINPHDVMWFDATGRQQRQRPNASFVSMMKGAPDRAPYTDDLGYALPHSFHADRSRWPYAHSAFKEINDIFYGPLPDEEQAYYRVQNFYFNCLRDGDRHLGTVLDALSALGLEDETVVVVTSDHGELAGAHRQRNKGPFMFKENIRVPLLVRHPRHGIAGETAALCSSIDLAPTLLSLAGVSDDQVTADYGFLKGMSLAPFVEGRAGAGPSDLRRAGILIQFNALNHTNPRVFEERVMSDLRSRRSGERPPPREWPLGEVQFEVRGFGRGIFDGRYKFARWFSPGDHHIPTTWSTLAARNDLELIDTQADPHEVVNLAADLTQSRPLIMSMNDKLNALIEREVGVDDGSYLPGDPAYWTSSPRAG